METIRVVVSGGNGQLGSEIFAHSNSFSSLQIKTFGSTELNICDTNSLREVFKNEKPHYFVNCAAYTAVDLAEDETEKAYAINHLAVAEIAKMCNENNCILIHISTDYVFDGTASAPYKVSDSCNPMGVYGQSKRNGELAIETENAASLIIRTAWVFSSFGKNFVKTMLRLGAEKESLNVVDDQIGAPTYARHLAKAILQIIESGYKPKNVEFYNFTNSGQCSWAQFASSIMQEAKMPCVINPIPSSIYPTKAKRPSYSVLDLEATKKTFPFIKIESWQSALKEGLGLLLS